MLPSGLRTLPPDPTRIEPRGATSRDRRSCAPPSHLSLRLALALAITATACTLTASTLDPDPSSLIDPGPSHTGNKFDPLPTADTPTCPHPIRFFVYGDTHAGYPPAATVHWSLIYRAIGFNPDFVLHLGDLIHGQTNDPEPHWRLFEASSGILVRAFEFYPTLGNHDVRNGYHAHYFDYFDDLPGAGDHIPYYSIEKPDLILIVLDVDSASHGSNQATFQEQAAFVAETVAAHPHQPYRFVTFHMPPYTSGNRGANMWSRSFHQVFRDHEINAVFCGHIHAYERFLVDGIHYVVAGGAGGVPHQLNAVDHYIPGTRQCAVETHGYLTVVGDPAQLVATAWNPDGEVIDEFVIAARTPAPVRRSVPAVSKPALTVHDAPGLGLEVRCEFAEQEVVAVTVHDLRGRRVRALAPGLQAAGSFRITWDGRDERGATVADGLYLVRLHTARGEALTVKATLHR